MLAGLALFGGAGLFFRWIPDAAPLSVRAALGIIWAGAWHPRGAAHSSRALSRARRLRRGLRGRSTQLQARPRSNPLPASTLACTPCLRELVGAPHAARAARARPACPRADRQPSLFACAQARGASRESDDKLLPLPRPAASRTGNAALADWAHRMPLPRGRCAACHNVIRERALLCV